jgi:Tol biopolymer transport system component
VSCVAVTGSVTVTATTTGADAALDGYTVQVDAAVPRALTTNGTVTVDGLGAGSHSVSVGGVASNCSVGGANPRSISVTTGNTIRDTARTAFQVSCVRAPKIAFVRDGQVAVALADGTNVATFGSGDDPTWSPDGNRVAYTWLNCDYYYGCYGSGLHVMNGDGAADVRLTTDASDGGASWHPLGGKLAFSRYSGGRTTLFVMNANGSSPTAVPLPASVKLAWQPAWSPDGTTIAFTCDLSGGNQDICLVNADGTNLRRLTSDAGNDVRPAWKPDGTQIAFATSRYSGVHELAIMNVDGSNVTRVVPGTGGYQPAWSPDGTKIAFAAFSCDIYYGCTALGISVVNANGSGLVKLTTGLDRAPSWRP